VTSPAAKKAPVIPIALGALALVVVIGLLIALSGGDDGDDGIDPGANSPAVTADDDGNDDPSGDDGSDGIFGEVVIDGDALPTFAPGGDDPAEGSPAPELTGHALDGSSSSIAPGEPTIVAFLAHWCPHCQAELPVLVSEAEDGTFDGVRMVAVLTGTNPDAPNFPPGEWLEREGWTGDVVLDDRASSAAVAFGLSSYPYLVAIDGEGNVVGRRAGELPADDLAELADAARGE
jgi:thiol-disulfide isomerase/thioredoxin